MYETLELIRNISPFVTQADLLIELVGSNLKKNNLSKISPPPYLDPAFLLGGATWQEHWQELAVGLL